MELAAHSPNDLRQAPLICSVNVLITLLDFKGPILPFFANFAEAIGNGASFFLSDYIRFPEGSYISLTTLQQGFDTAWLVLSVVCMSQMQCDMSLASTVHALEIQLSVNC